MSNEVPGGGVEATAVLLTHPILDKTQKKCLQTNETSIMIVVWLRVDLIMIYMSY
jgi:hypothetical protein